MIKNAAIKRGGKSRFLNWLLFLIIPLFSYISALKNYRRTWAKNVVWAFCGFFGYTLQISRNFAGDAAVYRGHFIDYYNQHTSVSDLFGNFFSNGGHIEIASDLIEVLVAGYTNDYHFLFLAFGLFFGFFYSRNIDYMYEKSVGITHKGSVLITVSLSFVVPFWNINGFDFWTASQVFLYGALPIIYEGKYNRVIFVFISPLVHFSFYLIIALTAVFFAVKRFKNPIIVFYVMSFFVLGLNPGQFSDVASKFLPAIIYGRAQNYLNATANANANSGGNILFIINLIYKFCISLVFLLIYRSNRKFIEKDKLLDRFFIYTFFLAGIFNILGLIPSVGRFISVAQAFMWIGLFLLLNKQGFLNSKQMLKYFNRIRIVLIVFWVFNILRYLFPLMGILSITSSPLWVGYFVNDDTVIGNVMEFLK